MSDYFLSTYYVTVTTIVHFLELCILYCPPSFPPFFSFFPLSQQVLSTYSANAVVNKNRVS